MNKYNIGFYIKIYYWIYDLIFELYLWYIKLMIKNLIYINNL